MTIPPRGTLTSGFMPVHGMHGIFPTVSSTAQPDSVVVADPLAVDGVLADLQFRHDRAQVAAERGLRPNAVPAVLGPVFPRGVKIVDGDAGVWFAHAILTHKRRHRGGEIHHQR